VIISFFPSSISISDYLYLKENGIWKVKANDIVDDNKYEFNGLVNVIR